MWGPVGLGLGITIYFSLTNEPSLTKLMVPLPILGIALFSQRLRALAVIGLTIILGLMSAKIRTEMIATTLLAKEIKSVEMTGQLLEIEVSPEKRRLVLGDIQSIERSSKILPKKVRLNVPKSINTPLQVGDRLTLTADLLPLSDPVSPRGYDFRRHAYFQGIEAVGRVKKIIEVLPSLEISSFALKIQQLRHRLTENLRSHLPGQTGEIAAALITGDRSGLTQEVRQQFADSGLAHILAISGLHLSLVAGLVFLFFRRGFALIPALAERFPIKKWSAVLVILVTGLYLAIAGFGIPVQRSYIMIGIAMIAILLDRNPLSMRLVAVAATVILLTRPESLLSVSFQLSFAAVVALIAAYESGWSPLREWSLQKRRSWRKGVAYTAGLMATTLIASLATTPFTIYVFNRVTLQAIAGNLLAIPLTGLLIMPAAMASVASLSIGGIDFCFQVFGWGINMLMRIAQTVAMWPGAAVQVPKPPVWFLLFNVLGGLWLCLWRRSWRWIGLAPISLGWFALAFTQKPDVLVARDGSVMAYHQGDTLYVSGEKRGGFFSDLWMRELGLSQKKVWDSPTVTFDKGVILMTGFKQDLSDPCQTSQVIISTGYVWKKCKIKKKRPYIIDRYTLNKFGTQFIWIKEGRVTSESVRSFLGNRPWTGEW